MIYDSIWADIITLFSSLSLSPLLGFSVFSRPSNQKDVDRPGQSSYRVLYGESFLNTGALSQLPVRLYLTVRETTCDTWTLNTLQNTKTYHTEWEETWWSQDRESGESLSQLPSPPATTSPTPPPPTRADPPGRSRWGRARYSRGWGRRRGSCRWSGLGTRQVERTSQCRHHIIILSRPDIKISFMIYWHFKCCLWF